MMLEYQKIAQEENIEMANDTGVKSKFCSFSETQLYFRGLSHYPTLKYTVLKVLLPFPTTY
jgi:hypothetical protein